MYNPPHLQDEVLGLELLQGARVGLEQPSFELVNLGCHLHARFVPIYFLHLALLADYQLEPATSEAAGEYIHR